MKNTEFVKKLVDVAKNHKTLYVLGCFGAPMSDANKKRYTNNLAYNEKEDRRNKILASSADTFGFDCVCLLKGVLWGWDGNASHQYGGATYQSNGVPDINADSMIKVCQDVSTDFSKIQPGEAVWLPGHIGVYIGDGLAVECTPKWKDGVQITAVHNIGTKPGYNGRSWTKHGKLPYVEYSVENVENPEAAAEFKIGDVVTFIGSRHYISPDTGTGHSCKPGKAKITVMSKGSAHPYHLIKVAGGGSSVYGWVDAADIAELKPEAEPEAPANLCQLPLPVLRNGSSGETVKALQILLIGNNCPCGSYGADGKFGAATENAIEKYQKKTGLPVSRICDAATWKKLLGA